MLNQISIRNYAIAESIDLHFHSGTTVISGETGAGKSLILDALALSIGARAESDSVSHGAERAEVSTVFDTSGNLPAQQWLKAHDLETGEECILRRTVRRDGRSRAFINGQPSTLANLRQLGELLIDIHSQHQHQSLLSSDTHRQILDTYANGDDLANNVRQAFRRWQKLQAEIAHRQQALEQQEARKALLCYQVNELDELGLADDELADLEREQAMYSQAEEILQNGDEVFQQTWQGENSCFSQLQQSIALLERLPENLEGIREVCELLESAQIQVSEASTSLRQLLEKVEVNPAHLQEINERIGATQALARKHRVAPEDLPAHHQQLRIELENLENTGEQLGALETELSQCAEVYHRLARKLHGVRKNGARKLDQAVTARLQQLGMENVRFQTQVTTDDEMLSANGLDEIVFMVTTNPGSPLKPLRKAASGGELSRISLALQVVVSQTSAVTTLAFDEVDVGVGGPTAAVVGALLRELGENRQVLCITHLPQVAAQGHHHLHASKDSCRKKTRSRIALLDQEHRVQEIARMLGGIDVTRQSLDNAKSLLLSA